MVDERELRRRAQPLIDRPPYERLPVADLHQRAATRTRRARARIGAAVCTIAVVATAAGVALSNGGSNDQKVVVRTTHTAPPITVPADTTIADLRFTPISGPDGDNRVEIFAAGDVFLAVEGDQGATRAWIGDASGHWRAMSMPEGLRGIQIGKVVRLHDRVAVIGAADHGNLVFLEGPSFDRLRRSPWSAEAALLPAAMRPAPPAGHGIVVSGAVDASAVGEKGIVLVGTVSAQLDRAVLPKSVRDAFVRHLGSVDVVDGRVVAWIYNDRGAKETLFDQPASALGISADAARYLAGSDASRSELAVWTARWGEPLRQGPATGIDPYRHRGNFSLAQVSDGFVLTAPTDADAEAWWSHDGRSWQLLAAPPRAVTADGSWLIEVGSRWVIPSAGAVSDDAGRSWVPSDIASALTTHSGGGLLGARGSSEFGLLGSSNAIDASTVTVFAGRLLYSPDGMHWSSVTLADALGFDANVPSIAVGDRVAMVEAGLRAPGPQPQRFWLVTRRG